MLGGLFDKVAGLFGRKTTVGDSEASDYHAQVGSFLSGQPSDVESSNVERARYNARQRDLELLYHRGGAYTYSNVSPAEATSFYSAPSKGTWVWDHLRARGSATEHQKPYRPSQHFATGGTVHRMLGRGGDDEPASLTPDEYVMPRGPATKYRPLLDSLSAGGGGGGELSVRLDDQSTSKLADALGRQFDRTMFLAVRQMAEAQKNTTSGDIKSGVFQGAGNIAASLALHAMTRNGRLDWDAAGGAAQGFEKLTKGDFSPVTGMFGAGGLMGPIGSIGRGIGNIGRGIFGGIGRMGRAVGGLFGGGGGDNSIVGDPSSLQRGDEPNSQVASGFRAKGGIFDQYGPTSLTPRDAGFIISRGRREDPTPMVRPAPSGSKSSGWAQGIGPPPIEAEGIPVAEGAGGGLGALGIGAAAATGIGVALIALPILKSLTSEMFSKLGSVATAGVTKPMDALSGTMNFLSGSDGGGPFQTADAMFGPSFGGMKDGPGGKAMSWATLGGSDALFDALDKVKTSALQVADAFVGLLKRGIDPVSMIRQYTGPFESQVGKYSPASVERFNIALDNLSASAGHLFEPIIHAGERFANDLNRLYTAVAEPIRSVVSDLAAFGGEFAREFAVGFVSTTRELAEFLGPFVHEMTPLGRGLGMAFTELFRIATDIGAGINNAFGGLQGDSKTLGQTFRLLGATTIATASAMREAVHQLFTNGPTAFGGGAALGAGLHAFSNSFTNALQAMQHPTQISGPMTVAAQPARMLGIEEVGQQARLSAFGASGGPEEQTAQNTAQMATDLRSLLDALAAAGLTDLMQKIIQQGATAQEVMKELG